MHCLFRIWHLVSGSSKGESSAESAIFSIKPCTSLPQVVLNCVVSQIITKVNKKLKDIAMYIANCA